MTDFLKWLWEKAVWVYELFGALYQRVKDAAINAYNWAKTKATEAYELARAYVLLYYTRARVAIRQVENWVVDKVSQAYYDAVWWATKQFAAFKAWVTPYLKAAGNWIDEVYQNVKNWAIKQLQGLKAWAKDAIAAVKDFANKLLAPYISAYNGIKNLIALFNEKNRKKTLDLLDDAWDSVMLFIKNPVGFIFGVIWNVFIQFLCFSLAYGLGTTKYSLPPRPAWKTTGGGGTVPPGEAPPPGESGLTPPLSSLYITGYHFGAGHNGLDLGLVSNQPVFAMHSGTVVKAGWDNTGYGNMVVIQGGDWWSLYAHFASLSVVKGDKVHAGDVLGGGNSTGNSTGNHLHLEIKYKGSFIDPATVLM